MITKIYLDMCSIQRPLDTLRQTRVRLEAEAVLGVIALCEAGTVQLISSEVLELELEQNRLPVRKEHAQRVLSWATEVIQVDDTVEQRAATFEDLNIKSIDALHLAAAEAAQADYFCTCDDRLLRKAKQIVDLKVKTLSPLELIEEMERW
jgi:predicted nucleic acid-binding protein